MSEVLITEDMLDTSTMERFSRAGMWKFIPIDKISSEKAKRIAYRLNSLGSLYYFSKVVLRKRRFTDSLHKPICDLLESWHLKEVIELPRDHFKSTICSECAPIWWALPFSDEDERYMRDLGYGDEWIRWMRRAHNQNTRTLLVSENITNAKKLGRRIALHYENSDLFRYLFPEILPNERCKWTEESLTHTRTKGVSPQGEGTYDFLGVGGALQSRHYDRVVQDDLVGRKALESEAVMESTIQYHQLIVGAFDASDINAVQDNDEVVVGNRWSDKDLGTWLRENEPYFKFHTHSALGGCCINHPSGKAIFPEEFSVEKLLRWKARLGTYLFSCQFLNNPTSPGSARWKEEYLSHYEFDVVNSTVVAGQFIDPRVKIIHRTKEGINIPDIMPANMHISMVVDPAHADGASQQLKRCRHAITVTGVSSSPQRIYLLDVWAEECSYEKLIQMIYKYAEKWHLRKFFLETIAAQKFLKFHLDYRAKVTGNPLKAVELTVDRSPNAKHRRIQSLDPIFENGMFWCRRNQIDFVQEFLSYPYGKTVDILDTLGYAPQTWGVTTSHEEIKAFLNKQKLHRMSQRRSLGKAGY